MPAKQAQTNFGRFLLLMAREAIEPIALALGIALLYTRLESILDTVHQTGQNLLSAISADSEAYPMIYFTLAVVFVAWIWYKAWKVSGERKRDRELSEVLTGLWKTLERMGGKGDDKE